MYDFLKRPAWVALAILTATLTVVFVRLGVWQMDRLEERRLDNEITRERREASPAPLLEVLDPDAGYQQAAADHEWRRVTAMGSYLPNDEVLIRSQTLRGVAGFHVLTPFLLDSGSAVLVNRGWVPLDEDTPPVSASPPEGRMQVELVLAGTEERGSIGPADAPDGRLLVLARPDIERISQQVDYDLVPVYGLLLDEAATSPVPVDIPELTEGTHLAYALQWFAFAVISVGGFGALARSTAKRGSSLPTAEEADPIVLKT